MQQIPGRGGDLVRDDAAFVGALRAALVERLAREPDEDHALVVAAHLLAATEALNLRGGQLDGAFVGDPVGVLCDAGADLRPVDLLAALLALDACLCDTPLPEGEIALETVAAGGFEVRGEVVYASPGLRPLRALREEAETPIGWDRPTHLLRHVHLWWRRSSVPLDARLLPRYTTDGRRWSLGPRGSFRVLLAPLLGAAPPRLRVDRQGTRWRFVAERREGGCVPAALRERLAAAVREHRVDMVVLPELLADPDDRAWTATLAGPRARLAGSWHMPRGSGVGNEALLADRLGPRGAHWKRGQFALRGDQLPHDAAIDGGPVPDGVEIHEGIEPGAELVLFDTPAGLATVVICADLLDVGDCLFQALACLPIDLVFVLAASPRTGPFVTRLDDLAHFGVATLLVNAGPFARPGELLAACRLPWTRHPAAPGRFEVRKDAEASAATSATHFWVDGAGLIVDLGAIAADANLRPRDGGD